MSKTSKTSNHSWNLQIKYGWEEQKIKTEWDDNWDLRDKFFLVKRVQGWGPEQRESEKSVLCLQIIIILISYIITYYYWLLN